MKKIIAAILILFVGYAAASPYVIAYRMKQAADEKDASALSRHIEFPTLRQNFKDQMNAAMAAEVAKQEDDDMGFAALGAAFGSMMVSAMIDSFVTPAAIAEMMRGASAKEAKGGGDSSSSNELAFEDAKMGYKAWDEFHVEVTGADGEPGTFVLSRRNIGWKLTNIIVPLD